MAVMRRDIGAGSVGLRPPRWLMQRFPVQLFRLSIFNRVRGLGNARRARKDVMQGAETAFDRTILNQGSERLDRAGSSSTLSGQRGGVPSATVLHRRRRIRMWVRQEADGHGTSSIPGSAPG